MENHFPLAVHDLRCFDQTLCEGSLLLLSLLPSAFFPRPKRSFYEAGAVLVFCVNHSFGADGGESFIYFLKRSDQRSIVKASVVLISHPSEQ